MPISDFQFNSIKSALLFTLYRAIQIHFIGKVMKIDAKTLLSRRNRTDKVAVMRSEELLIRSEERVRERQRKISAPDRRLYFDYVAIHTGVHNKSNRFLGGSLCENCVDIKRFQRRLRKYDLYNCRCQFTKKTKLVLNFLIM